MPPGHELAWSLFLELSPARQFSEAGPGRIPPQAIAAWFSIRGIRPNSRILWFLTQLDVAWLSAIRKLPAA